jgi:hypothetical protein
VLIYPNVEMTQMRLKKRGLPPTEASVRALVQEELDRSMRELAAYKRVGELILSDSPLPKTAIQKVIRHQLHESYTFDYKRWEQSAADLLAPPPEEPQQAAERHSE